MFKFQFISRSVWILSLVSLFTDVSSEMLYPILPVFLKSIGFSIVFIGVLEGIAEATAGLSKGYFGAMSDAKGKRLPFVQLGYLMSAISKPMMAILSYPIWIFASRTIDRLGKGVRTGARDAMLSDEATPKTRAEIFGFHRTLDTFGAALGPIIALIFLYFNPGSYKTLFLIAFIPGLIAVACTFILKENKTAPKNGKQNHLLAFIKYIPGSSPEYKKLIGGLLLFTLANSSDLFLLLMLKQQGFSDSNMLIIYIFYNLVYALMAYPAGKLADQLGLKNIFVLGLLLFVIVYIGMAFNTNLQIAFVLFFLYGTYAACTEGVSKAWISNSCDKSETATAIGSYESMRSITTMLASSITGLIWVYAGASVAFLVSGVLAGGVIIFFVGMRFKPIAEI